EDGIRDLIVTGVQTCALPISHLISEFEGLIDEFTIIEQGRELLTMDADAARDRFRKIRARFAQPMTNLQLAGALNIKQNGREVRSEERRVGKGRNVGRVVGTG